MSNAQRSGGDDSPAVSYIHPSYTKWIKNLEVEIELRLTQIAG